MGGSAFAIVALPSVGTLRSGPIKINQRRSRYYERCKNFKTVFAFVLAQIVVFYFI